MVCYNNAFILLLQLKLGHRQIFIFHRIVLNYYQRHLKSFSGEDTEEPFAYSFETSNEPRLTTNIE